MPDRMPSTPKSLPTPPPLLPPDIATDAAADLAACRATLAHGSRTFLAASRLLPRRVCEPAAALYAFCRLADDAVDGPGGRHGAVERLRERLVAAFASMPRPWPADRALALVVAKHGIPFTLFEALLEGFEWDTAGRRYESLADLEAYAARVAGSVGAMMALLMGARGADALARACDLGVAMQLSNIARDVGEDAAAGRLYLPRAWLREAGIDPDAWLRSPRFSPALGRVVQRLLDAAEVLYARAAGGVPQLPLDCRPGIHAARLMYAEIGHQVARRGFDSVGGRARVPAPRKLWLLLRAVSPHRPRAGLRRTPPLAANLFLIDAALAAHPVPPVQAASGLGTARDRNIATAPVMGLGRLGERVAWTIELFARLEERDLQRVTSMRLRAPSDAAVT